ncbi:MAG TPA: PIN domain-containing protein [Hyphomicrobiaceae bacterium]|nr:PIN domain-containing protein [Hyphomicrobiaceae bacterium]
MSVKVFLDTNVLVYAVDTTRGAAHNRQIARKIVRDGNFGLSAQVLQEFFVTVTRKIKRPLSKTSALRVVSELSRHDVVPVDASLVCLGIAHSLRYQISYWDGAIIAAAEALGAKTVFSEDLSHGQKYGDVEVLNPFL